MARTQKNTAFVFVLYPEDPSHVAALDAIKHLPGAYWGILHDRDLDDDGNPKKSHWHVVYKPVNPITLDGALKRTGVSKAYCEACHSVKASVRYNFHLDNPEKFQYDTSLGFTNAPDAQKRYCSSASSEAAELQSILEFFAANPTVSTFTATMHFCEEGLLSTYRRCFPIIRECLYEIRKENNQ